MPATAGVRKYFVLLSKIIAMNAKKLTILIVILIIADQLLKIWVKTNMALGESIVVFPDWFQLRFVENSGFAFGMELGRNWGKIFLSLFRIAMAVCIGWYLRYLLRDKAPTGVIVGFAMIFAGAVGNIIDSTFYGMLFSASTPDAVAQFGGHYAGLLHGRVVDMFYFPLFRWDGVPEWLSFLVDGNNYFFGAIFNMADAYISVAVVLLCFYYKYFNR